jgi:hypothetical protein
VTDAESRFAARALRRKRLFLVLSIAGLVIAAGLSVYYIARVATNPDFPIGPRLVIVVLILLNARQNLRQYRFAGILEQVLPKDPSQAGEGARAGR